MEMPSDDQPPEAIWLDDDAIAAHFERLRDKYASGSGGPGWEPVPAGTDETENALAKAIRGGR
jgi:hypothetical protein